MGKYQSNSRNRAPIVRNQIPAAVRGIGCITMAIIPVLSYGIADYCIKYVPQVAGLFQTNPALMDHITINPLLLQLKGLQPLWSLLQRQDHLGANLILTVALIMVIGGLMAIVYGYIYSLFGPSRYGPTDVPPPRVKTKKYTR